MDFKFGDSPKLKTLPKFPTITSIDIYSYYRFWRARESLVGGTAILLVDSLELSSS